MIRRQTACHMCANSSAAFPSVSYSEAKPSLSDIVLFAYLIQRGITTCSIRTPRNLNPTTIIRGILVIPTNSYPISRQILTCGIGTNNAWRIRVKTIWPIGCRIDSPRSLSRTVLCLNIVAVVRKSILLILDVDGCIIPFPPPFRVIKWVSAYLYLRWPPFIPLSCLYLSTAFFKNQEFCMNCRFC